MRPREFCRRFKRAREEAIVREQQRSARNKEREAQAAEAKRQAEEAAAAQRAKFEEAEAASAALLAEKTAAALKARQERERVLAEERARAHRCQSHLALFRSPSPHCSAACTPGGNE